MELWLRLKWVEELIRLVCEVAEVLQVAPVLPVWICCCLLVMRASRPGAPGSVWRAKLLPAHVAAAEVQEVVSVQEGRLGEEAPGAVGSDLNLEGNLDPVDQNGGAVDHKEGIPDLAQSCQAAVHSLDQIDLVEVEEDRSLHSLEEGNLEVGKETHRGVRVARAVLVVVARDLA